MSPSLLCVGRWSFLRTQAMCSAFTGPPQHSSIYTLHSGYLLGISPFNGLSCEMTNARLVHRWLSLRVNFLRWRREGLRTFSDVFWDVFFVESKFQMMCAFFLKCLWMFLLKIIPRSLTILVKKSKIDSFIFVLGISNHMLGENGEWNLILHKLGMMWKKFPWVLLSPSPSVPPYHQTALRSMWAPLRNSETWRPTSCGVADGQRFTPTFGNFHPLCEWVDSLCFDACFKAFPKLLDGKNWHLSLLKRDRDEKSILMVGWPKKGECQCFSACLGAGHSQETHGGSEIAKSSGCSNNKLCFSFNKKFLTFSQVLPFSMFWWMWKRPQVERLVDFERPT